MDAEPLFLDTTILVAATDASRRGHSDCARLLGRGLEGKAVLRVSGQVLREYLVVATRPTGANGMGMTPRQALGNVTQFRRVALVLPESLAVTDRLFEWVREHRLAGKPIHDASLIAAAAEHGIGRLVTLNPQDFAVFGAVRVLSPAEAMAALKT